MMNGKIMFIDTVKFMLINAKPAVKSSLAGLGLFAYSTKVAANSAHLASKKINEICLKEKMNSLLRDKNYDSFPLFFEDDGFVIVCPKGIDKRVKYGGLNESLKCNKEECKKVSLQLTKDLKNLSMTSNTLLNNLDCISKNTSNYTNKILNHLNSWKNKQSALSRMHAQRVSPGIELADFKKIKN